MGDLSALNAAWMQGLQWGHGREAMDGASWLRRLNTLPSFNGAMAVRPWMDVWHTRPV